MNRIKLNKLGWIVSGILFMILAFETGQKNKQIEIEKITPTETAIPTTTLVPTTNQELFLVTKVIDGDTLMIKINNKVETIRLIGVDTPETVDPRKTVQCFGREASQKNKELTENKMVKLEADLTQTDKDKYGRLLRYVYLEDGTLINKKLIEEGFGFEYTYQIPYKFQSEFKAAQKEAENKQMGMWADGACPTPTVIKTPTISRVPTEKPIQTTEITIVPIKAVQTNSNFACDCSKTCTQISSCEEAYYQLNSCGCSVRDNDRDGVPCESLCN